MKSGTMAHRTSSVHTSSSHHSTIETRGLPEFDREYARQLSVAKGSRNSAVKVSPRTRSPCESPLENQLLAPAATAASRIKDYVVTHVSPPGLRHRGDGNRTSERGDKDSTAPSPKEETRSCTNQASEGRSSSEDEALAATQKPPSLTNASHSSTSEAIHDRTVVSRRDSDGIGSLLTFFIKCVVTVGIIFFVLLCSTAFVVSSTADYNPLYFSGKGASSLMKRASMGDAVAGRSWPNRLIPEFHQQIALHIRHALLQSWSSVEALAASASTSTWSILRHISLQFKGQLHPSRRHTSSSSSDSKKQWSVSTLVSRVMHTMGSALHVTTEPIFLAGRGFQSLGVRLHRLVALVSPPLKPLSSPSKSRDASPVASRGEENHTAIAVHSESAALLYIWRPLSSLWRALDAVAFSELPPRGNGSKAATLTTAEKTNSTAVPPSTAPTSGPRAEVSQRFSEGAEVRTTHTRRLPGKRWTILLQNHKHELEDLVNDDLREVLNSSDVAHFEVELRPGSLVIAITVFSRGVSEATKGMKNVEDVANDERGLEQMRRSRQAAVDAALRDWRFPRTRAFYNRFAAPEENSEVESAASAAVEACEGRLKVCQEQQQIMREELNRKSEDYSRKVNTTHQAGAEALRTVSAGAELLRGSQEKLQECSAAAAQCRSEASHLEKRVEQLFQDNQNSLSSLAEERRNAAAAAVAHAKASERERQKCAMQLDKAAQTWDQRLRDARSSLEADFAVRLSSAKESCADMPEDSCAAVRATAAKECSEKMRSIAQDTASKCSERLNERIQILNNNTVGALAHLQEVLRSTQSSANEREEACAAAVREYQASLDAMRRQRNESCVSQVAAAHQECEKERRKEEELCAGRLRALNVECHAARAAAVRDVQVECNETADVMISSARSDAALLVVQLQGQLNASLLEIQRISAAGEAAQRKARVEIEEAQRRWSDASAAQLSEAVQNCSATIIEVREADRKAAKEIVAESQKREEARLLAQCALSQQASKADFSKQLAAQREELERRVTEVQQERCKYQLRSSEEAFRNQNDAMLKRHQEEVRQLGIQLTSCAAEARHAAVAQQQESQATHRSFVAAIVRDAEEMCLLSTQQNRRVCAAERTKLEQRLQRLSVNASFAEVFSLLHVVSNASARLTWTFKVPVTRKPIGDDAKAVATGSNRAARLVSALRAIAVLLGLLLASYTLLCRRQDQRLYQDTVDRLNAVTAADTSSTAPLRSQRDLASQGVSPASFGGKAFVDWSMVRECMSNTADILLRWHYLCCATLLDQEANGKLPLSSHALTVMQKDIPSLPDFVRHKPLALLAAGGSSISCAVPTSAPQSDASDSRLMAQLYKSFVEGYYGMLEMYHVDLLNAITNREVAEQQLEGAELVVMRQAAVLQRQSAAVAQLKQALSKEGEAAASCGSKAKATEEKLEKAERRAEAQEEMIALLEEQLKVSRQELDNVRGAVQTPAPTPRSAITVGGMSGANRWSTRPTRSLQELAEGRGDSNSASEFSVVAEGLTAPSDPSTPAAEGFHGNSSLPYSTKKSTMVRNSDTTRRYHQLQWDDDSGLL